MGSSLEDLSSFPDDVKRVIGFALRLAQMGQTHVSAKPIRGFKGASVMEIVDDFDTDTYRGVYTTQIAGAIVVLHCFQKKSKSGAATPPRDIKLIERRLKAAKEQLSGSKGKEGRS